MRILILGGGFGGLFTAMHLVKAFKKRPDIEVAMVNEENYFIYYPMLAEIISGNLSPLDISVAIRDLCPRMTLYAGRVEHIDIKRKAVTISDDLSVGTREIIYDHLVIALGMKENFSIVRGLTDHGFHFKNVADALIIRNHLIDILEKADVEEDIEKRRKMLTFVVAGGGFSGVEAIAEMNDYVRGVVKRFRNINPDEIRMILLEGGTRILPQFPESLSEYARKKLISKNVEIRFKTFLKAVTSDMAVLADDSTIETKTLVATIGIAPNPAVKALPFKKERGRIEVNYFMEVPEYKGIWALGDCAYLLDYKTGEPCPTTAQYAVREGRRLASNIVAEIDGKEKKPFSFHCLGMLGSLGEHSAVGDVMGVKISGLMAWLIWRFVYWTKLPGFKRKTQVAIDWFVNYILPYDIVHYNVEPTKNISHEHFEAKEVVFKEDDAGDRVYVILDGEVEIVKKDGDGREKSIAKLTKGECFGEMALISDSPRNATARTLTELNVLTLDRSSFKELFNSLPLLRESFQRLVESRTKPKRTAANPKEE